MDGNIKAYFINNFQNEKTQDFLARTFAFWCYFRCNNKMLESSHFIKAFTGDKCGILSTKDYIGLSLFLGFLNNNPKDYDERQEIIDIIHNINIESYINQIYKGFNIENKMLLDFFDVVYHDDISIIPNLTIASYNYYKKKFKFDLTEYVLCNFENNGKNKEPMHFISLLLNTFYNGELNIIGQFILHDIIRDNIFENSKKESIKTIKKSIHFSDKDIVEEKRSEIVLSNVNYTILTKKYCDDNYCFGREREMFDLMTSLLISEKGVCIKGASGVGKTALIKGFAYKIANNDVPNYFKDYTIIQINSSEFVKGCQYVGMLENRVETVVNELTSYDKIILFIDEVHQTIGAGSGNKSNIDVASLITSYIDSNKVKIISCTTDEDYDKYINSNSTFKRRFLLMNLKEPDEELNEKILIESIPKIEISMKIQMKEELKKISVSLIAKATNKKNRIYNDKVNNPDLSLSILKRCYAHAVLYDKKEVDIEDIIISIMSEDRIYPSVRQIICNSINNNNNNNPVEKVLNFPMKNS